jgi:hypothetical protein
MSTKPSTRRTTPPASRRKSPNKEALAAGLHAAVIELATDDLYRVRTLGGARVEARLAEGVDPALALECLRGGRSVLVTETEDGVRILGALQTQPSLVTEEEGLLRVQAKHIRIAADKTFAIEAGPVRLRVDPTGVLRLEGEKMVIDMGALVRFLSARVELP